MIYVLTCTNQLFACFSPGYRQLAIGEQSTECICCSCYFSSIYLFLEDIGANPQTRSKDFQPSSYDCEKDRITDMTRKLDRQFQSQNTNNPSRSTCFCFDGAQNMLPVGLLRFMGALEGPASTLWSQDGSLMFPPIDLTMVPFP